MSGRITRELVIKALVMALSRRRPAGELMHHSDREDHIDLGDVDWGDVDWRDVDWR
jgi:hypothetical protein